VRLLWIDAGQGAAGDMLLAALLDAGADAAVVGSGLRSLAVEPISLHVEEVRRHGQRARSVRVAAPDSPHHRRLPDILELTAGAALPPPVVRFAGAVFHRLARAEATVHGIGVNDVHFHEVGALDSIADIVGGALALWSLDLLPAEADAGADGGTRVVSPVAVGSGSISTAHGILSVPAPAVLELLVGAPLAAHHAAGELCTPTGAALLTTLADHWGPLPACVPGRVGVGAGQRDPASHPNILRVVLGQAAPATTEPYQQRMTMIEATVDDLDPRLWPDILETLREIGAADAWCGAVLTRKGRPGQVLSVLSPPDRVEAVCQAVFAHTSTLGLRRYPVDRQALARRQIVVAYQGQPVSVKLGLLDGAVVTAQPEYEDVRRAAAVLGVPARRVLDEVARSASPDPEGTPA